MKKIFCILLSVLLALSAAAFAEQAAPDYLTGTPWCS